MNGRATPHPLQYLYAFRFFGLALLVRKSSYNWSMTDLSNELAHMAKHPELFPKNKQLLGWSRLLT